MKIIFAVVVLTVAFSVSNAFWIFNSGPKDGCNPNPCKHKGQCTKDPRNPMKPGTCTCQTGYYGLRCENKDGCYKKPCKSGTCIVDTKDKSKYRCQCPPGKVGDRCEKTDGCAKNPCKNGGTCSLDGKLKMKCQCPPGWSSTYCHKRECPIVQFKGKHFDKLPKLYIDKAIEPMFKELDNIAKKCKVHIQQSRSYSVQSKKIITAADAPFYIGRGIEFSLNDDKGRLVCNEICLSKRPIPQPAAKCFVDAAITKGWKWNPEHPTILHDATYTSNYVLYNKLRDAAQVGCKEKSF